MRKFPYVTTSEKYGTKKILGFACLVGLFSISATLGFEALPKKPPIPVKNQITVKKIELGKTLYFDPRLSKDGTVSCNSCHNVMAGGEDNRSFSAGVGAKLGGRSAPTVWNAAFLSVQFWDGRAPSLEEQAKGPLINPVEMAMENHAAVVSRLQKIPGYARLFRGAFGTSEINIDRVVDAIATFERTLITPNSPVDQYVKGKKSALTPAQVRGMKLVQEVGCLSCHSGPNYAGPALPEGVGFYQKFPVYPNDEIEKQYQFTKDEGRKAATKQDTDKHLFRVPTWRNIALTAPYFHNGSVANLGDAVKIMAKLQLNKDLDAAQVNDIVAFLEGLTGKKPKIVAPELPPTPSTTLTAF